ncbi:Peptidyl-tRNA hydrolase 2 [Morus notabilis]|uniref:peptidyl-tRNA hydrolase n=1 Tax=Morus notabilis TaxID=981085 RepID=W9RIF3_9ROSA|nr:Peptidyl-tRNA hydrolase 2 [Morus notabilis]
MFGSFRNPSQLQRKTLNRIYVQQNQDKEGLTSSFRPENFIPGIVIGFILGMFFDLAKPSGNQTNTKNKLSSGKVHSQSLVSNNGDQELKMVLVVRQDLRMKSGKIASQCAHAATGMYAELVHRNRLKEDAESIGLPTFVVADAGRTQVSAGSNTVLAIGPGPKAIVDSVTGKQCLL